MNYKIKAKDVGLIVKHFNVSYHEAMSLVGKRTKVNKGMPNDIIIVDISDKGITTQYPRNTKLPRHIIALYKGITIQTIRPWDHKPRLTNGYDDIPLMKDMIGLT